MVVRGFVYPTFKISLEPEEKKGCTGYLGINNRTRIIQVDDVLVVWLDRMVKWGITYRLQVLGILLCIRVRHKIGSRGRKLVMTKTNSRSVCEKNGV